MLFQTININCTHVSHTGDPGSMLADTYTSYWCLQKEMAINTD